MSAVSQNKRPPSAKTHHRSAGPGHRLRLRTVVSCASRADEDRRPEWPGFHPTGSRRSRTCAGPWRSASDRERLLDDVGVDRARRRRTPGKAHTRRFVLLAPHSVLPRVVGRGSVPVGGLSNRCRQAPASTSADRRFRARVRRGQGRCSVCSRAGELCVDSSPRCCDEGVAGRSVGLADGVVGCSALNC
jgi:hypothetical protein